MATRKQWPTFFSYENECDESRKTGTTCTTASSSPCTTSIPMTTLTSTTAWRTTCIEFAHIAHCSQSLLVIHIAHSWLKSRPRSYSWRVLFDSTSPFFLYLFFLPFSVFFLHPELFLELDNPIVMASLRYFASEESEDSNFLHSHTFSPASQLILIVKGFNSAMWNKPLTLLLLHSLR